MPRNVGLQPTEIGVEATAGAARRIGAFYNQTGQALERTGQRIGSAVAAAGDVAAKFEEHREISAGAAAWAQTMDGLTSAWNNTVKNADPNDPSVKERYREETLEPALQQFQSAFLTEKAQNWALGQADSFREHMFQKTSADMAGLAKRAVHSNLETTANTLGNTVYNDPSALDHVIKTGKAAIDGVAGSSPTLSPEDVGTVKSELGPKLTKHLVNSAIQGAIANGGDWQGIAKKYPGYIDQAAIDKYVREEKRQRRSDELEAKQAETYQRQKTIETGRDDLAKLRADAVSFDENGKATIAPGFYKGVQDIENKYRLHEVSDYAETVRRFAQSQAREKAETIATNPDVHKRLYDGLFDPVNPTTDVDIMKAAANPDRGQSLSSHDTQELMQLHKALEDAPLKGPLYQGTMEAAKGILGVNLMGDGHQRYANFLQTFIPEYLKLKRAGTLPPNALDTNDKTSLIGQALEAQKPTAEQRRDAAIERLTHGLGTGLDDGTAPQPTAKPQQGFTGRTATNPKTGERLRETKDGKWIK